MPDDLSHDQRPTPNLLPGRLGTRLYSQAALLERVEVAFRAEYSGSDTLAGATTRTQRLHLILGVVDYLLAVESIPLPNDQKAALVGRAFSHLFGYGPLDALFEDETITTIALEGAARVAVRYGHGDLTPLGPLFEDKAHLRRVIDRLVQDAGAALSDDTPVIETGLRVHGRPLALRVAAPPMTPTLYADFRLHPAQPLSFEALVEGGMMTGDAAHFLGALVASPFGIALVGESETGKTTLLNAMLELAAPGTAMASVERAGELRLPDGAQAYPIRWPVDNQAGISFAGQVEAALATHPALLALDEVRADESGAIAPLLESQLPVRQWWAVRGVPDAKRLQSGLGMLARRAAPGRGEDAVHELYRCLPFVVSVARIGGRLQVFSIAEWQANAASEYPDYGLLYQYRDGAARSTGRLPQRAVALG